MEFELEDPLTSFQEHQSDAIPDLFASESDHMQSQEFLSSFKTSDFHVSFRREAISYILQRSRNMDPFIPYLAINYTNRFISKQDIPEKPWMLRLLALSCLSLAAKMKSIPFLPSDFKGEKDCCFETQAINKMELLILDALDWRMRSLTPFPFLYFFLSIFQLKDPPLRQALKLRAIEIIFQSHNEIELLKHKPSIIAASALLSASYELFPLQFPSFKASILTCKYVNKENLMKCFNGMQEMVVEVERCESTLDTVASTRTPVSVLDRGCTHWECENINNMSNNTVGTENRDTKRRKLNAWCLLQDNAD
ncbi:hypothetical protein F2P56_007372 [Juglans regia]|uniref:B-like cyclin n=1 Tax=Juglans regia TaxID=51240 RepID=A0A834D4A6_JUGRE|nr:hypothetical protein F2P56_007372 [Juglans regia]